MKFRLILMTIFFVFLTGMIVRGTFSYQNDQEKTTDSQWTTGSLDIDVAFPTEPISEEIDESETNAETPRNPTFFQIKNIGTQPFFYHLIGSIPEGQPNRCQNVRVRLWKAGAGRRAVYAGKVNELDLSELNSSPFFLMSLTNSVWRYQLRYPGNTENCKISIVAQAWQSQILGGFHDQASIIGEPTVLGIQNFSLAPPEISESEPITIDEQVLANDDGIVMKRMGDFLLGEITKPEVLSVTFTLEYEHTVGDEKKTESITGVIEPDATGQMLFPEQYIGRCSVDESECQPFEKVKNMNLMFQLVDTQSVTETLVFPLKWSDAP